MAADISITLDDAQKARLDAIAEARQETTAEVVAEAIAGYLTYDAWFVAEVEKGLASLERGEGRDFEAFAREMRARMKSMLQDSAEAAE